ncbi:MAG TPA: hypothetical protein VF821_06310 [Lentzea sp.]
MSETPPERPASRSGSRGGKLGLFTEKIGPLPMWIWVAIIAVILIGWRLYSNKKQAASSAASTGTATDSVPADQVPQFVNQTYTTVLPPTAAPPAANPQPVPATATPAKTPAQTLTRTWISQGGSTYAQVAQRLIGTSNVSGLHHANAAAQKWVADVYAKNHNAKMPKGLYFSYTEGTVTNKAG